MACVLYFEVLGAYMVRICVGRIVQNHRLGQIPPKEAEIFDVVAEDASTVVLIQAMSTRKNTT